MKQIIFLFLTICTLPITAQNVQYQKQDSVRVMRWLQNGCKQDKDQNMMLYFARQLKGIPYVAKTLEKNQKEKLVINTRQLDCTTYVENILSLYLCHKNNKKRFEDYCNYLRYIRYRNGEVSYANRLHYFSLWMEDNVRMGYVHHIEEKNPPFSAKQKLDLHFMTTNTNLYPMIYNQPAVINKIKKMEESLSGKEFLYIPKDSIENTELLRETIKDGDIIALLTRKKGLDTTHIGIAV